MVRFNFSKYWPIVLAIAGAIIATAVIAGVASTSLNSSTKSEPSINETRPQNATPTRQPGFSLYEANNISVPVDHFHNNTIYEPHSDGRFPLRYWFNARHYREGGPVIILLAGESDGEKLLSKLEYGLVAMLAESTGGIVVILEHRYYGQSFPVPDLSAENMRFLSTEQTLADMDYFARRVQFPGLEHLNLTAPATPYILYGGSYPGALAAFARKIYPETFWGAIASSAVTEAIVDYWEYFEAARLFAPGNCAEMTQKLTHVIDTILKGNDRNTAMRLKGAFRLRELEDDAFAAAVSLGIKGLQDTHWDSRRDGSVFGQYCASVSSNSVLFASTRHLSSEVGELLSAGGYRKEADQLTNPMLNYVGFVRKYVETQCENDAFPDCFLSPSWIDNVDLEQDESRSYVYQCCTEWGHFQTGSVPKDQLPLISRLIDLNYETRVCRQAFNITEPPNIEPINKLGGLNFSYPRVAFVDGEYDPWRAATPHRISLPERKSTVSEPFILIEHGVHCWDLHELESKETEMNRPPPEVANAQAAELEFVKIWLDEWKKSKA